MIGTTFKPVPLRDKQWKDLQQMNPEDVCHKACVTFDKANACYTVTFMGKPYRVYPQAERVEGAAGDKLVEDIEFHLLLLTYLLSAQEVPLDGSWVSEKDLQGGALFFKGPHTLPDADVIKRFGKDPHAFVTQGKALGGKEITEYGDAAMKFQALPRIPIACVLWVEDEEFPARVSYLFDPSVQALLPLDVVLALVRCVVQNLISGNA